MSNHYFTGVGRKPAAFVRDSAANNQTVEEMQGLIEAFLSACRLPAVLEQGEELLPAGPGEWTTEIQSGRLLLHVLTKGKSLSRRIMLVERLQGGILHCRAERFGARNVKVTLLDLARPQSEAQTLRGHRASFGEKFRRMLLREFPGWEVKTLSAEMDLSRSLSPVFPRATLERRNQTMIAMACPTPDDESALLTFALLWYDLTSRRLRERHADLRRIIPLQVFLPDSGSSHTAQRLQWLNPGMLTCRLFRFNEHGSAGEVDAADLGNLETTMQSPRQTPGLMGAPEAVMEVVVRANLAKIDASLLPETLQGEVITRAGHATGRADLLCLSETGELVILELKTKEDIQLPLQALDYWMRIAKHAERGELDSLFAGRLVLRTPPRLILVAPALSFHPSTATLLRYLSSSVRVERVGVNLEWQQGLKVVMRLAGSREPASHAISG